MQCVYDIHRYNFMIIQSPTIPTSHDGLVYNT